MSKCLVTGACGFIGSHMVEVLAAHGEEVVATDLKESFEKDDLARQRFPSVIKKAGAAFIPSNVTDKESLKPVVKGVEKVFHIAAIFSYSISWQALKAVNVDGTKNLFSLLLDQPIQRIVLWGAGGIYGIPRPEDLPLTEEHPKNPPNPYLKSKWIQEKWAWNFCRKHKLPLSSVRPTGAYGPRATYGLNKLIRSTARSKQALVAKNFTFRVPSDHVKDICEAAYFISNRKEAAGEAYHVNDDSSLTYNEFTRCVAEHVGNKIVEVPSLPIPALREVLKVVASGMQAVSKVTKKPPLLERDVLDYFGVDFYYSNEKIKKLGYRHRYPDARVGIRETIDWMRKAKLL